jgi:hypothetical protein
VTAWALLVMWHLMSEVTWQQVYIPVNVVLSIVLGLAGPALIALARRADQHTIGRRVCDLVGWLLVLLAVALKIWSR